MGSGQVDRFRGRRFPEEIIVLCVRWYLRYTIDFLLSPNRDLIAAKGFLQLALSGAPVRPRVIDVDGHPAYATAIAELKDSGELSQRCRCRPSPYLNNIIEQDHRFVKKRITTSQGFRSVEGALSTIAGYEAMNIIRKGQFAGCQRVKCSARSDSSNGCSESQPDISRWFTDYASRYATSRRCDTAAQTTEIGSADNSTKKESGDSAP